MKYSCKFIGFKNEKLINNFKKRCYLYYDQRSDLRIQQIDDFRIYIYDSTHNRHYIYNDFGSGSVSHIPGSPNKITGDTIKAVFKMEFKYLLQVNSLTLKELSGLIDIPINTLYKYYEGLISPKMIAMLKIANYFDVPIDKFVPKKSKAGDWYEF